VGVVGASGSVGADLRAGLTRRGALAAPVVGADIGAGLQLLGTAVGVGIVPVLYPTSEVTVVVADAYPNFSICGIP
jgi:hypothetical protein